MYINIVWPKKHLIKHYKNFIVQGIRHWTNEQSSYHSWWMNLILPVHTQGWKRGLSWVPSDRHTLHISAARKDGQNKHLKPIRAEHIKLHENKLDMSAATNTLPAKKVKNMSYELDLIRFVFQFILMKNTCKIIPCFLGNQFPGHLCPLAITTI